MNLDLWKTAVHDRLTVLAQHLADLKTEANRTGAGIVYGALATATILPLVETARQAIGAGDYPLLMSLGGLAAAIGGNLVAEQISRWKDRTEPELRQELGQKAQTNVEWREALDKLLEHFAAPSHVVQAILSEADKDWFARQLRAVVAQLGSRLTVGGDFIQATVGNNSGTLAIGKQITQIIHIYRDALDQSNVALNEERLGRQVQEYLRWVADYYGKLTLRGIEAEGRQVVQLPLDQVYVPLEATAYHVGRADLPLNRILTVGERLVIVGGPGCGKSTVLQHIAWVLATALLTDDPDLAAEKLGLALRAPAAAASLLPMPILIPLSAYARQRRHFEATHDPHERTLAGFIWFYLTEQQCSFGLSKDFFVRLLEQGRLVMLLLDGLDEVPNEVERANVRAAIEKLVNARSLIRAVVACRSAAYKERSTLSDFHEVRVRPLADSHVQALVARAYTAIYPHDAITRQKKIEEMSAGIAALETQRRQRLGEKTPPLIDSPLLVRMLMVVHLNDRRLPEHRAELYMRTTENLLMPAYGLESEARDQSGLMVGGKLETHRELVQHLAFAMYNRGEKQGRQIEEDDLKHILAQVGYSTALIDEFIALTRLRSPLLEERQRVYQFSHLAFQEFLAARHLAEEVRDVERIAQFFEAGPILESWWREPALLVAGYLSKTAPSVAVKLLQRLADNPETSPHVQLAAAEIAAVACKEWLERDVAVWRQVAERIATIFANHDLMITATPTQRAAAGVALGRLGDRRPGVGVKDGLPAIAWSEVIAPGPFIMGSDKHKDRRAYDNETPQFTCNLIRQPYCISRYPITVAQYQTFVEVGGYEQQQYWTEAGWQWRQKNAISGPATYGESYQTSNHPQVGVSWYEAVAFCHWLSAEIKSTVRLPTETEWERAARHTDGRIYPWGNEFDPKRCNMRDTEIGATSAVGVFPNGAAVCGALDMSGNAWEWCGTQWTANYDDYEKWAKKDLAGSARRVLRGGSFFHYEYDVRCAFRYHFHPDLRNYYCGFRVCLPRL